ncbi:hypothetical protein JXM67_11890 [candidate division WOR-3 bacterium]|nr:hypothetical protein [candidate division WOR-3 bacterium]
MNSRPKPFLILGVIVFLALTFGAAAQETEAYTDTIDLTEKVRELLAFVTKINNSDSLPIFAMFHDSAGEPVQGVKLELDIKKTHLENVSDENGEVVLWVSREDRKKIKARAYGHQSFEQVFAWTFSGESESEHVGIFTLFRVFRQARKMPIVTGEGFEEFEEANIRILYPAGYASQAQVCLDAMIKGKAVVDSVVGMRLFPFKVILNADDTPRLQAGGGWCVGPEPDSSDLFHTFIHEWVEMSLDRLYDIYDDEEVTYTRWIGDGLANNAAFSVSEKYYPRARGLKQLHDEKLPGYDPEKTYDLKKWKSPTLTNPGGGKSVGLFGYLIAPYFWAKVVDKSGNPELIPEFLEEYRQSEDKSSEAAIAILTELSGLDIETEMVITGKEYRENVGRYWPEPVSEPASNTEPD